LRVVSVEPYSCCVEILSALFAKTTGAPQEANEFESGLGTVTPGQLQMVLQNIW